LQFCDSPRGVQVAVAASRPPGLRCPQDVNPACAAPSQEIFGGNLTQLCAMTI
jgi:hypothetical protein